MQKLLRSLLLLTLLLGSASTLAAQITEATTFQLYDITLNGTAVTIDGDLSDWQDAQFLFLSQDKINFLQENGDPIQGVPADPWDFSGFFAMKMDDDNLYVAIKVRDDGTPMIETPATSNLAFVYDHLSVYLGLYDIGARPGSPHIEGEGNVEIYDVRDDTRTDTLSARGRTYRIKPGIDNQTSTLGADYQLLLRNIQYGDGAGSSVSGADVQEYNGALVDTTIADTEASSRLTDDEDGYILEWRIPFAALADSVTSNEYRNIDWPLFVPQDGMVIPFDADLTDLDAGESNSGGATRFLRLGNRPSLWRDSKSFSLRGRIVDVSENPNHAPSRTFFIDYKSDQGLTIDADLSDWEDAYWAGLSQDKFNFLMDDGTPIQNVPDQPADFSGYIAAKIDDTHLYFAAKVRDEDTPMRNDDANADRSHVYDHLGVYLGLYDLGDALASPHTTEAYTGTTYRIAPSEDQTGTTLGPDYHLMLRALPYGDGAGSSATGGDVTTYSGGLIGDAIANTEAASKLVDDDEVYILEWKVPLASLAGNLGTGDLANATWPTFTPMPGMVLAFDAELTDLDAGESNFGSATRVLRLSNHADVDTRADNFGMRALIVEGGVPVGVSIETNPVTELPQHMLLEANYPNPFNPTTTLAFTLPQTEHVRLAVYDLLGQEVAVLVDQQVQAGRTTVTFDASGLASGVYLYRLDAPSRTEMRTMVLLK